MYRIMNFRTGSAVRGRVMHRCRSWTVFSALFIRSQLDVGYAHRRKEPTAA